MHFEATIPNKSRVVYKSVPQKKVVPEEKVAPEKKVVPGKKKVMPKVRKNTWSIWCLYVHVYGANSASLVMMRSVQQTVTLPRTTFNFLFRPKAQASQDQFYCCPCSIVQGMLEHSQPTLSSSNRVRAGILCNSPKWLVIVYFDVACTVTLKTALMNHNIPHSHWKSCWYFCFLNKLTKWKDDLGKNWIIWRVLHEAETTEIDISVEASEFN